MTIKTIYFIRHGQTEANSMSVLQGSGMNPPLSAKGIQQAQKLRDRLSMTKIDLFITSDLNRAKETCDIVAEMHPKVERLEYKSLQEIHWGEWEKCNLHDCGLPALISKWNHGQFNGIYST